MNNFTIPSILIATILIAGVFALIPIEEASTLHTTIQATQITLQRGVVDTSAANIADGQELEITSAGAFCITSIFVEGVGMENNDDLDSNKQELNNVNYERANNVNYNIRFVDGPFNNPNFVQHVWTDRDVQGDLLCFNANDEFDFIFDEGGADEIELGEIDNIEVWAFVDGDNALIVTQGPDD